MQLNKRHYNQSKESESWCVCVCICTGLILTNNQGQKGQSKPDLTADVLIKYSNEFEWQNHSVEGAVAAPGSLHVQLRVPNGGDGADRLDHMADHVDNGQVDDGPVDIKQ